MKDRIGPPRSTCEICGFLRSDQGVCHGPHPVKVTAQMRMVALLQANVRAGEIKRDALGPNARLLPGVVRGAPTHDLAYLLTALEEQGWTLTPCEPR